MKKLKLVLVAGVLVAISVLSVAGLCFSDDVQPVPDATTTTTTTTTTMPNVSSVAPDGLGSYSVAPAPLQPQSIPPDEE